MKRSLQEVVELVVFGLVALLVGTALVWVLGWVLSLGGALFKALAGLLWLLLRFIVPIAIVAGLVYFLVKALQGREGREGGPAVAGAGADLAGSTSDEAVANVQAVVDDMEADRAGATDTVDGWAGAGTAGPADLPGMADDDLAGADLGPAAGDADLDPSAVGMTPEQAANDIAGGATGVVDDVDAVTGDVSGDIEAGIADDIADEADDITDEIGDEADEDTPGERA